MNWFKSLFTKPKPETESSMVIFFDNRSVEVPDKLTIQELRMLRFFPPEVIDALEVARDNRVIH